MSAPRVDVAVVGGGPAGAAAALALSQAGFSVRLLEGGAAPRPPAGDELRVYALSPASVRLLAELGAWTPAEAAQAGVYGRMCVWAADPARALCFDGADAGVAELGWIQRHDVLLHALWQRLPASVAQAGSRVVALEQDADGRVLRLESGATLHARLVVAADGAASPLRRLAGLRTVEWRYPQRALVANVRTARAHEHTAWQRFLPSGPLAFLPLADGRCSIVWSADEPLAGELLALDDAAFALRLRDAVQDRLGAIEAVGPRLAFPLRALQAERYTAPHLVLLGDAAHGVHPLAGQGLNLGFGDVEALSRRLREARDAGRDWTSPRVLAGYARTRQAANLEMLALTDALYRGFGRGFGRSFGQSLPGAGQLLGAGFSLVAAAAPLRAWFARRAVG